MIDPIRFSGFHLILALSVLIHLSMAENESIYEILKSHGLPMGLLPKGVKDFDIDNLTGRFEARLDQACNAKFESELHYDMNVSGTLSYGQIRDLSGITAQELFLWFPIKGIRVDIPSSGVIYFDVGVVYKRSSLSLFENPRDCVTVWRDLDPVVEIRNDEWSTIKAYEHKSWKLPNPLDDQKFCKECSLESM